MSRASTSSSSSLSDEQPSSSSTAVSPCLVASPIETAQRGGPRSRHRRRKLSDVNIDNDGDAHKDDDEQHSTARRGVSKRHARTTSVDDRSTPYTSAIAGCSTLPSPVFIFEDPNGETISHRPDPYQPIQRKMTKEMDPLFCDTTRARGAGLSIDRMPPLSSPWSESSAPSEGIITPQDPSFSPLSGPSPDLSALHDSGKLPLAHATTDYDLSPVSRPSALAAVLDLDEDDVPPLDPQVASSRGDGAPTTTMRSMRFDVSPMFVDFASRSGTSSSFSASSALSVAPIDTASSFPPTGASTYRRPTDDYSALALAAAGSMNGNTTSAIYSLDSPLASPLLPPSEEAVGLPSLLRRGSYKFSKMRLPSMLSLVTAVATTPRHPRAFIIDTPPSTPQHVLGHHASVSPKRARSPVPRDLQTKAEVDYLSPRAKRIIGLSVKVGFWISVVIFLSTMFGYGATGVAPTTDDILQSAQHAPGAAAAASSRDFGSDSQLMAEKMFMGFGGVKPRLSRLNGGRLGTGRVLGSETSYKARAMLMRGKDAARQMSGGHIVTFRSDAEEDAEAEAEWAAAAELDPSATLRSGRARMQEAKRLEAAEKAAKRKIPGQSGADVKIRQWWDKYFGPIERAWEDERARRLAA